MSAPASYARRQFPGAAADTTISGGINNSVTSCSLSSTSGWPTGAYTGGVLCELYSTTTGATAEKVWATDLTGSSLTIVRAADGTSATSHAAGTGIRPVAGAVDADEANKAVAETVGQVTTAGDLLVADGAASMTRLAVGSDGQVLRMASGSVGWGTVGTDGIAADAVTAAKIAADAVGSSEIAADAVGTSEIAANAVTSSELADNAVDTAAIADNAVTNAKLADDAVDSAEIADGAIDLVHMSANSVDSDQYVDGSIDTAHIGDDQVTLAKVAASAKPRWMIGPFVVVSGGGGNVDAHMGVGTTSGPTQIPVPEACAVVGVSVRGTSARVSGSATFDVTIDGTATGLQATLDGVNTQTAYATQSETADPVTAGQGIGVYYDTTSYDGGSYCYAYVLLQAV